MHAVRARNRTCLLRVAALLTASLVLVWKCQRWPIPSLQTNEGVDLGSFRRRLEKTVAGRDRKLYFFGGRAPRTRAHKYGKCPDPGRLASEKTPNAKTISKSGDFMRCNLR